MTKNAWLQFKKLLDLALKKNNNYEMPLKKIKLESVEDLEVPKEIPVAEPNENNADPKVQGCSSNLDCFAPAEMQKCEVDREWVKTNRVRY